MKPARLHLDVFKDRRTGRWFEEIRVHHVGWTDILSFQRDTWADALDHGLRVMRRLAE